LEGKSTLETVLLLARRTPLPVEVSLARLLEGLPEAKFLDPLEVAVRGHDPGQPVGYVDLGEHRGPKGRAEDIDHPLLELLGRLETYFETTRAVRFAHRGD
jgi:hypothetical protein